MDGSPATSSGQGLAQTAGTAEAGSSDLHQQPISTSEQALTTKADGKADGEAVRNPQGSTTNTATTTPTARSSLDESSHTSRDSSESGHRESSLSASHPGQVSRLDEAALLGIDCLKEAHQVRTGQVRPR